jgi:hypothetical protein
MIFLGIRDLKIVARKPLSAESGFFYRYSDDLYFRKSLAEYRYSIIPVASKVFIYQVIIS